MPRQISAESATLLSAYVRACQHNAAQDVTVGFRECSALLGIPYSTVRYHLGKFTERGILDLEAYFVQHPPTTYPKQQALNIAVMKWREGRALTHAACRCRYPRTKRRMREKGATLQEEARWLASTCKKSRRSAV